MYVRILNDNFRYAYAWFESFFKNLYALGYSKSKNKERDFG